jgi:hypothetical protein
MAGVPTCLPATNGVCSPRCEEVSAPMLGSRGSTLLVVGGIPLLVSLLACAGERKRDARATPEPEGGVSPTASAPTGRPSARPPLDRADCIVVRGELAPQPTSVEGVLTKAPGDAIAAPFVLHLTRPRCVIGLEHASFVTDVYVASTGADLRPLLNARLRVTGDAIAGESDVGGPAIVLLAKDFERARPSDVEP